MKRTLLCHDGTKLTDNANNILYKELLGTSTLDILYVIPQNLIHYGQVDQLATPHSKQTFIDYVQKLGVEECKEKLMDFVNTIKSYAAEQNVNLHTQLHVRWGDATAAIKDIVTAYAITNVLIPSNVWGLDWHSQQNLATKISIPPKSLYIL